MECKLCFQHWQIPLGRRFRAMKLWFVLRLYGVHGIQEHVRNQIKLAQEFEFLVKADSRFEMPCERSLALICFRLKVCIIHNMYICRIR